MAVKGKISTYEKLVFVAYGFYLLLGLAWFLGSIFGGHFFNVYAFAIVTAFGAQFYYRHRITNLILGILTLFFSIWMILDAVRMNLLDKTDAYAQGAFWFCILSMVLSGILIFSYTKLSFRDQEGG